MIHLLAPANLATDATKFAYQNAPNTEIEKKFNVLLNIALLTFDNDINSMQNRSHHCKNRSLQQYHSLKEMQPFNIVISIFLNLNWIVHLPHCFMEQKLITQNLCVKREKTSKRCNSSILQW